MHSLVVVRGGCGGSGWWLVWCGGCACGGGCGAWGRWG